MILLTKSRMTEVHVKGLPGSLF